MTLNFSGVPARSLLGRVLRAPLNFIPRRAVLPVLQGPLRGMRWVVRSGNHGYWLGSYESETQATLTKLLRRGEVFYDVGANVGFFSLLGSALVGAEGKVVAFEPLPRNLSYLHEHLRLNKIYNVQVMEAAVSAAPGRLRFSAASNASMGRLDAVGSQEVVAVSLDAAIHNGELAPPAVVKMDIEGGELDALKGALNTMRRHRPALLLSSHGWARYEACCALLSELGYQLRTPQGGERSGNYETTATHPLGSAK